MKIVHVAPPDEPVPPKKYGGIELVVYNMCEEMVKMGHEVHLFASGDSKSSAILHPLFDISLREMLGSSYGTMRHFYKIYSASKAVKGIVEINPDIVINHADWRYLMLSPITSAPVINVCHVLKQRPEDLETFKLFKDSNYVSISDNQRKAMPHLNWSKTIYNGIDTSRFDFVADKGDYFAFLGRTSPDKGLGEICQMIRKTNHKLKIGAKIDYQDSVAYEYYKTQVEPYIDGEQIEFLGEIDHAQKNELLKHAKALLIWLNWEEPFGMVFPEAYACGTPVIGNNRGSLPEIVENGKTGFLIDSIEEMAKKLDQVDMIDRAYCRKHVQDHFSQETMAEAYIKLAKEIIG
ncbi:MAG: glycosyltransferase family 4 protein [bacterium]|nr:glycosyltransferase family 4 protein [bacterium]